MRPKRMFFASRRSSSLTRSPYSVPGSTRLTVADGALRERFLPRDGAIAELGAAQFAASEAPLSLRMVPPICTSTLGIVYDPSAVYRVIQPVWKLHHGLVGLSGVKMTLCSGIAARTAQKSVDVLFVLQQPWIVRPFR